MTKKYKKFCCKINLTRVKVECYASYNDKMTNGNLQYQYVHVTLSCWGVEPEDKKQF